MPSALDPRFHGDFVPFDADVPMKTGPSLIILQHGFCVGTDAGDHGGKTV